MSNFEAVIFLDFDGVLHPGFTATFEHIARFEKVLKAFPKLSVVISSGWREGNSLEALRKLFSPKFRPQIVGITPFINLGNRQLEVETFCRQHDVKKYLIIDDDESLFDIRCKNLYIVDHKTGLTNDDIAFVKKWARENSR